MASITKKALPTTQRIDLIDLKKVAIAVLDKNMETFIIHVALFTLKTKKFLA